MISSMTGYGRSEIEENGDLISVEIRSLNHRFLDVDLRLPRTLFAFEREIKALINSRLSRGRISATINIRGDQLPSSTVTIDRRLASTYIKAFNELKNEFKLDGSIQLEQVLSFPDILSFESPTDIDEAVWNTIKVSMERAIDDLEEMRLREGLEIKKDLVGRVGRISETVELIEHESGLKRAEQYQKLRERVKTLTESEVLNEGRLEMEVAVLVEKADVTEECIRFKSHNIVFLELLENGRSEGRRLNFLLQEMHREANTIGAKANDSKIAHWVVDIKEEVEKLREQIQNIE